MNAKKGVQDSIMKKEVLEQPPLLPTYDLGPKLAQAFACLASSSEAVDKVGFHKGKETAKRDRQARTEGNMRRSSGPEMPSSTVTDEEIAAYEEQRRRVKEMAKRERQASFNENMRRSKSLEIPSSTGDEFNEEPAVVQGRRQRDKGTAKSYRKPKGAETDDIFKRYCLLTLENSSLRRELLAMRNQLDNLQGLPNNR